VTISEELASLPLHQRIAAVIEAAKDRDRPTGDAQDHFADLIGVARETVNRWVNGQIRPRRTSRQRLADLASELYKELISPDLFREYVTDRRTPLEETAALLAQATTDLIALLAEQRQLVEQMSRIATALEQREAASGGGGG